MFIFSDVSRILFLTIVQPTDKFHRHLGYIVVAASAKIGQTMGSEFEYLPVFIPTPNSTANTKAEFLPRYFKSRLNPLSRR